MKPKYATRQELAEALDRFNEGMEIVNDALAAFRAMTDAVIEMDRMIEQLFNSNAAILDELRNFGYCDIGGDCDKVWN